MSFRRITQSLVALIVITKLMITVCESLPKYCQCIESNGNPFSAFAEYFIKDGKSTEFWLYQNKHRCRMYIKNKTEIVIDTSGQIRTLERVYRQWFGFYTNDSVYQCRNYPQKSQSEHEMECRLGNRKYFEYNMNVNKHEYSYAVVFIKEAEGAEGAEGEPSVEIESIFQNESIRNWRKIEKTGELLTDIGSNVNLNAILNAFDAKNNTKGFFIFVTNIGIPMYCYKSHIHDLNDSCKIENLKPFMRECYQTNETTIITTENPMNSINTTNERTKNTISPSISTINPFMTTFDSTESPSTTMFWTIIIKIIVIIILIAITISLILYILHKRKNDNNVSVSATFTPSIKTNEQ